MDFVSQQPNGRYCLFSTVVDTVTHWYMTAEEYIEMCAEKARINENNNEHERLSAMDESTPKEKPCRIFLNRRPRVDTQ